MKKKISFIALITILTMLLVSFPSAALNIYKKAEGEIGSALIQSGLFTSAEVKEALLSPKSTTATATVLSKVTKPSSMGISLPNIDLTKISVSNSPLLKTLPQYSTFCDELLAHSVPITVAEKMTYAEYNALEKTWQISAEYVEIIKGLYIELKDTDISTWTYGDCENFMVEQSRKDLINRFSAEQLLELKQRNIEIDDTFYLFKDYHTADAILSQSDAVLKSNLEKCYAINLDMALGEGTAVEIAQTQNLDETQHLVETMETRSVPSGYYTYVYFPHYGNDYFQNSVAGTATQRGAQADDALLIKGCLYGIYIDATAEDAVLNCSNMYGTYSYSQGGAHEGIDFAYGTNRTIFSPVEGVNLNASTYHQLSIYDSNHNGSAKTFSFLHMTNRSPSPDFYYGQTMGTQGQEGNATGYHTHFEVHSGQTTALSASAGNHVMNSLSPYFCMDPYLGWT